MKKYLFLIIIIIFTIANAAIIDDASNQLTNQTVQKQLVVQKMNLQPLAFTENQGQWDESIIFRANAGGATMWFAKDGAYYQFTRRIPTTEAMLEAVFGIEDTGLPNDRFDHENDSVESIMIKASFVGANPDPNMVGLEEMEYKCNYFIGNDPNEWHTDVPNYQSVIYEDIYAGIDLKYYGNGKQMEYDFIVSPGADLSQILVQYEGAKSLSVNESGELVVETDWNRVIECQPYVYQYVNGERVEIEGKYCLTSENTFTFKLSEDYNPTLALVIDPILSYSTYLGGGVQDFGQDIAIDNNRNIYVTGSTSSDDFPTENPYQSSNQSTDVFVTKISSSGSSLIYSTYLGGGIADYGYGIAIDVDGNAYVTGQTNSSDFPTVNPFQTDQNSIDAFICKLNSSGNDLIYSTYLGGADQDWCNAISIDDSNYAYVTGMTWSINFPIENAYQSDQHVQDVFVTKLSKLGNSLIYSTHLGGNDNESGLDIYVDNDYNVIITGKTRSSDFPSKNPYQLINAGGMSDVFVTKLSSTGDSLIYSTYLGGSESDEGNAIEVDYNGNTYVTGLTSSTDFPTENPYQTDQDGVDVFVTKFSISGDSLIYSTYLGGGSSDHGYGITVDGSGNAYVTGFTYSEDYPTKNPFQESHQGGLVDAFVTKLSSSGDSLIYSTYLGGNEDDVGYNIALDDGIKAYIVGYTYSSNFPTQNPYQMDQGSNDVIVTIFSDCIDSDGDDICDTNDNCSLILNPDQEDFDNDLVGDSCDNCMIVFNPNQTDTDSDLVGDSCDVCPNHTEDNCCDPTIDNDPPVITSPSNLSYVPGNTVEYIVTSSDLNCDGVELIQSFEDYPSWCSVIGDTLIGSVECEYADTSFKVIVSDGELDDTLEVTITIDLLNQPPEITDTITSISVRVARVFSFYPTISDIDDSVHTISYLNYPHWCAIHNDSVIGTAPDTLFFELLKVVVQDYCHADTFSFVVDIFRCGDSDGNGSIDISDAVYLINYIFGGGPAPDPLEAADADCSLAIDVSDAVYLIAYIFGGGPAPCEACP